MTVRNTKKAIIPVEVAKRLKKKVINYDEFISNYESVVTFREENGLVIIIPEDLKGQLSNFDARSILGRRFFGSSTGRS